MIIVGVLEDFVELLGHECPEVINGTKVKDLLGGVNRPMVIWHHELIAVNLIGSC